MGKVKVVPVEQEAPVETLQPEVKEESPSEPEVKSEQLLQGVLQSRTEPMAESLAIEAPVFEEPAQTTKKKQTVITCKKCGKTMLMKTFKYSHSKVCKPSTPEPPPPPPTPEPTPPPTPEPKAKAKRAPPKPKAEKTVIAKPEFNGQVSFNHFDDAPQHQVSHIDLYRQAREQRQQVRVQRVRSLISQAI